MNRNGIVLWCFVMVMWGRVFGDKDVMVLLSGVS